jgi:hypothetical protein
MNEMDDRQHDGLTPKEVKALEALPREQSPPPHLEDQIVKTLQARGLVQRGVYGRSQLTAKKKLGWFAGAIAASVALLAAGFAIGQHKTLDSTPTGSQFVLLLYEDTTFLRQAPAESTLVEEYRRWAGSLRRDGRLISAEKLNDSGMLINDSAASSAVREHVPEAAEGIVSGYFVIAAKGYDDAVAVARASPHVRHGGRISVRAIDPT